MFFFYICKKNKFEPGNHKVGEYIFMGCYGVISFIWEFALLVQKKKNQKLKSSHDVSHHVFLRGTPETIWAASL